MPSFHDLSVGEALAHAPQERENSGGGKFPSQIRRRKDQPGSLGIEEKRSPPFPMIGCSSKTKINPQILVRDLKFIITPLCGEDDSHLTGTMATGLKKLPEP